MTRKETRNEMYRLGIKNIDVIRYIKKEGAMKCSPSEFSLALSGDLGTDKAERILEKAERYINEKKRGEVNAPN